MSPIGIATATGARPHRVTVQNDGGRVPDGDGGYIEGWADATPPQLYASIESASTTALERVTGNAVVADATHLIHVPYHPQLSVKSRLLFNGRTFSVLSVINVEERNAELILVVAELLS